MDGLGEILYQDSDISDLISYYEAELNIESNSDDEGKDVTEPYEDFDWEYEKLLQKSFGRSSEYLRGLVEAYEDEMKEHLEAIESLEGTEDIGMDLEFEYEKALIEYHEKCRLDVGIVELEKDLYDNTDSSGDSGDSGQEQEQEWNYHLNREEKTESQGEVDENKINLYRQQ